MERGCRDLVMQGEVELAVAVRRFVKRMNPPQTAKEWPADRLLERRPPDCALQLRPRAR